MRCIEHAHLARGPHLARVVHRRAACWHMLLLLRNKAARNSYKVIGFHFRLALRE